VDLFHDTLGGLESSYAADIAVLRRLGYEVVIEREAASFCRARVRHGDCETKIEWAQDSAFRFFPVERDLDLGWRLHFWDAATNKILAAADRQMPRDYLDVLYLDGNHLPLGALVWAAAGKDPGFTPESLLAWVKRNAKYQPDDFAEVCLSRPVDLVLLKNQLRNAVFRAEAWIAKLPIDEAGCFYLNEQGNPVCPDPDLAAFHSLTRHFGSIKGAWPRILQ
jgi:hypothetical protein